MKALRESIGIAVLCFQTSALEGGEGLASCRPLSTPWKDPVTIVQEAGWAPGPAGQVRNISPPPGFDPRTVQPGNCKYLTK
jgi:hypothetical protein